MEKNCKDTKKWYCIKDGEGGFKKTEPLAPENKPDPETITKKKNCNTRKYCIPDGNNGFKKTASLPIENAPKDNVDMSKCNRSRKSYCIENEDGTFTKREKVEKEPEGVTVVKMSKCNQSKSLPSPSPTKSPTFITGDPVRACRNLFFFWPRSYFSYLLFFLFPLSIAHPTMGRGYV